MIFPIGDDQVKGGHFPLFSYAFIALNVLVFVYQLSLIEANQFDSFLMQYGAIPAEITSGSDWHTLFSSMFMHGGWGHIIGNILFLWVFGDNIEATVGSWKFVLFYFIGGLAAHAAHIFFYPESVIPTVGASGAIAAVMGAYLVMFPTSRVRLLIIFFSIRIPAILFLGLWIFQQFSSGLASFSELAEEAGVAWWAHIGGFLFGIVSGVYFRQFKITPVASSPYA
jgi:membrane associated rhomboid family serine protease